MLWSPPESPFEIEYAPELVSEVVRLGGLQGTRGILYGHQDGDEIQVVAPRRTPDARPEGTEKIGVFAVRSRGDVFMTEGDLKWFGENEAAVALVVAGNRAGFFVRSFEGTLQSIRSYQEIAVEGTEVPSKKRAGRLAMPALALGACGALLAIVFATRVFAQPPINLAVAEREGQLLITWNREARAEGGRIEITDGGFQKIFTVSAGQWSATYTPVSREVQIRLSPPAGLLFGKADLVRYAAR